MRLGVCLSEHLSVACLDLIRERKGQELAVWKPITRVTHLEVERSKVKVTKPINAVTDNALQFS